jgi:hypothetical protein
MPSHIFIRLGLWDETIASNRRSFDAGIQYVKAQGLTGAWYHEFHALDYMIYGHLQQGHDSAARAIINEGMAIKEIRGPTALTRGYNRTAMRARYTLERNDWAAAADFSIPDSASPFTEMLVHFTRGIGAARSGNAEAARREAAALEQVERGFAERGDSYWSRITGIKREAVQGWAMFAAGDTAGGLKAVTAAAEREDVTEKHPVTPGELLPARELEADMRLAVKDYAGARAAYLVVRTRDRRRARAVFGAARAAELAGDRATAASEYRAFLAQMEHADRTRPELAIARSASGGR